MPNIKSLKASEHQKFNCSNVSLTQPKNNQKLSTKIEDDCNSQEECDQGSNPNKPLSSIIKLSPSTSTLQTDKKLISSIKDQPFLSNHHRFYDFNKFQKNEIRLKRNHPHLKRSASSIDNQFKKKEQSNEAQIKSSNIKRDILIQDLILNKQKTLELPKNIHRRFFRSKTRSGVIHTFCGTSDCPKESYDFGEHSQQGILMKKKSSLCYPSQQSLSYLARGSPSNNNYNQFEIQLLSNEEQIGYAEEGNKDFNPSFIKSRNHSHSLFFGKIDKNTILEEIDKESNEIIKTSKSDFKNQQNTTPSILNLDQKINSSEQNKGSKNLQICITQPIAEIKGEDNARLASQPNLRLNSSTQAAKVSNLKPNHNIQLSAESFNLSNYAQNAAYQSCNNSLNNSNNNFFVRKLNAQLKQTRVQSPTITTSTVLDQPDFKDQKDHVLQNKISFQIPDLNSGILEKGTQKENNIENNLMTNYTINIGNYFEKRYCQICRIDQPTRSKHCLICKRCVSTFDHHCPWIGVCIAQRNRIYFLFFVTIQNMSVVLCFLKLMVFLQKQWSGKSEQFLVGVVLSSIAVVFLLYTFLMTFLLIVQHIYYISKNITTWEYYSWEKITYLKEQPKRLGSPFSFGTRKNIQLFIQSSFFSLPYEWQINKLRLPAVLNN